MASPHEDPVVAGRRKSDHIDLAFQSRVESLKADQRFDYEPMMAAHPGAHDKLPIQFAGHTLDFPMWVSSMTGGTEMARIINTNLARMCGQFGFGMGLGSCRSLLHSDHRFEDFDVRHLLGDNLPLFTNLGIAQVEELIAQGELNRVNDLVGKLRADGLIVHINPLQEWAQPEGDAISKPPIETVAHLLDAYEGMVIVKEVGQGMGPESMRALLKLPIEAVEFAAQGGTNFTKLEMLRQTQQIKDEELGLALVGHTAVEMVNITNQMVAELGDEVKCKSIVVSGGLTDYLDGFYLTNKLTLPAIYGHASRFLKYATGEYETLEAYAESQIDGLKMANAYLRVR